MASVAKKPEEEYYDVYLSFGASDTRHTLINTLYHCITDVGIQVYENDEDVPQKSDCIRDLLEHTKICVAVFSEKYAESIWCLEEVVLMADWEKRSEDRRILPIFYKVKQENVKLELEGYREVLAGKVEEYGQKKVDQWETALKYVGEIPGWPIEDKGIMGFSASIADEILLMLNHETTRQSPPPSIMTDQVHDVIDKLGIGTDDVRFLVIHGKPRIGKTTLAKLVFNQLSALFRECIFLEDIEEALKDYAPEDPEFLETQMWMEERYRYVKVLIVLDGVSGMEKIKKLAGKAIWFGPGSRIIITTSDESIMPVNELCIFEMREMEYEEALQFFCWHAFERISSPKEEDMILSWIAINCMGPLPLGLEILGSFLYRKSKDVWEDTIMKLKESNSESRTEDILEICYASLDFNARLIFLDIACFFVNKEKTDPTYMWKASVTQGIEVLLNLTLVKIVDGNKLWMHNRIRDFGREKVLLESSNYMERSRFWNPMEALDILKSTEAKKNAEIICLQNDKSSLSDGCTLGRAEIEGLQQLRFLQLYSAEFRGDFTGLFPKLRWLSWRHCPRDLHATSLSLRGLAILDLSRSNIDHTWAGWHHIRELKILKVLDLTGCECLTWTPDFSGYPALERLILKDCKQLAEIDSSIGNLKNSLKYLNVDRCDSLKKFPDELCTLAALTELVIGKENEGSFEFPEVIGSLQALVTLEVNNVWLIKLPDSIGKLRKLKRLSLSYCCGLKTLPDSIGGLKNLESLSLSDCWDLKILPDSIGGLENLERLTLSGCGLLEKLPESIDGLKELKRLMVSTCWKLKQLPDSIGGLKKLEHLSMSGCRKLKQLPDSISGLKKLECMSLSGCVGLEKLPESIGDLSSLTELDISYTEGLINLPETMGKLADLKVIRMEHHWVKTFPTTIGSLTDLDELHARGSQLIREIPGSYEGSSSVDWIGSLGKLECLGLGLPCITALPAGFGDLSNLKSLVLWCGGISHIPKLPPGLSELTLQGCREVSMNLSDMEYLSTLRLVDCRRVEELRIQNLKYLVHFIAVECTFRRPIELLLPTNLRMLDLLGSDMERDYKLDLSRLKNLIWLDLRRCEHLVDIQGLGKLKCVEGLVIEGCSLMRSLKGLSSWKEVKVIELIECGNLQGIDGLKKLKSLKRLTIRGCNRLETEISRSEDSGDHWYRDLASSHRINV